MNHQRALYIAGGIVTGYFVYTRVRDYLAEQVDDAIQTTLLTSARDGNIRASALLPFKDIAGSIAGQTILNVLPVIPRTGSLNYVRRRDMR